LDLSDVFGTEDATVELEGILCVTFEIQMGAALQE
jgi:hypothetical protein